MMNKIIKMVLVTVLLTATYQSQAQQNDSSNNSKRKRMFLRKRMFFYPSQEGPIALVVQPLTLFPNPASDLLQISIPREVSLGEEKSFTLEIVNNQGVKILQKKWPNDKIDLTKMPPGAYVVSLKREYEVYSQKLAIIRE